MVSEFRLLRTGHRDAAFNMGLDEAIVDSVSEGLSLPTLRLYGWTPSAVSIGYFQGMRDEVDTEACGREGVDCVRRITGGGAVFHDAELTYSIVIPEGHRLAPRNILDSYALICSGIVRGLSFLGIEARFAPINDIVTGGKKISGNAQTRKKGCLLQHGTILISVDPERMFRLLKVPKEKAIGKLIADVKARVTSVSALVGASFGFDAISDAMERGFGEALGLAMNAAEPSAEELSKARELALDKFSSDTWNYRR